MRLIPTIFSLLLLSAPLAADEGFSSLEEQMTGSEFSAAGLDKLTPDELKTLNDWIRRHSLATLEAPSAVAAAGAVADPGAADRRGLPTDDGDNDEPIVSRLVGAFSGWDGQTVFKLENGMIWVQDDRDKHYVREIQNPEATIARTLFGNWHLTVEGSDEKCKVRRIQ